MDDYPLYRERTQGFLHHHHHHEEVDVGVGDTVGGSGSGDDDGDVDDDDDHVIWMISNHSLSLIMKTP